MTKTLHNIIIYGILAIVFVAGFSPIVFAKVLNPADTAIFIKNDSDDTTTGQLTAKNFVASDATATSTFKGLFGLDIQAGNSVESPFFTATSTTATSTFSGALDVAQSIKAVSISLDGGAGNKGYNFAVSGSEAGVANMFAPGSFILGFGTNNIERMRIDSSGNVGIGTTSPLGKLEVSVGNNVAGLTLRNSAGTADKQTFSFATEDDALRVASYNDTNEFQRFILSFLHDGNVGIASTTPAQKLSVEGIIYSGTGGFQFPDGTTQTTAAVAASGSKFGGDGSDGALTVTSGTTSIDLGGAQVVVKNFTSISITGSGVVDFTNPNTNGTIIIFKSQGDVTLTSSATPLLDLRDLGGPGGAGGGQSTIGVSGTGGIGHPDNTNGGVGGAGAGSGSNTTALGQGATSKYAISLNGKSVFFAAGAGGGGGGGGSGANTGGAGGRGGGTIYIEVGGAFNFTTTNGINVSGTNGSGGTGTNAAGPGGGGGGAGGLLYVLYDTLTANTGSVVITGGSGANGTSTGGSGGAGGAGGTGTSGNGDGGNDSGGSSSGGGGGGGGASQFGGGNGTNGTNGTGNSAGGGGGGGAAGNSIIVSNTEF